MGPQKAGWLIGIVRSLFGFFDQIVYWLVKWVIFGVFDLARIRTNSGVFGEIYQRLYVILGIFMVFKLSFSFFKYIIDPESFSGKSDKGLGKIFSRVFIMLAALIFLPALLFGTGEENPGYLSRAQDALLPTLPKIIFGTSNVGNVPILPDNDSEKESELTKTIETSSDDITAAILGGFFYPVSDEVMHENCRNSTIKPIENLEQFTKNIDAKCGEYYAYNYMYFVSTIVGVLALGLLLGITLSVAKRVFKLLILQAIAPIPIMSLMDPKGSKDGAFSKWIKSLLTTFGELFMKLGIIYVIIFFIQKIVRDRSALFANFPSNNEPFRETYLTVLLILGLIFFAKEAPKFIKDALGIKGDSGGLFDDVKAVGKAAGLVGGAALGTAGVIGSAVGNVRAQHQANKDDNEENGGNFGKTLLHGARNIGAAISGTVGGTRAGIKGLTGKDGGIKSVMQKQQERNAKDFEYRRNGGTLLGGIGAGAQTLFTGYTPYEGQEIKWQRREEKVKAEEAELKPMQDANARRKSIMDRVNSKAEENDKTTGVYTSKSGTVVKGNYRAYNSALIAANNGFGTTKKYVDSSGNVVSKAVFDTLSPSQKGKYEERTYFSFEGTEIDMREAEDIRMGLLDANKDDYYVRAYNSRNDGEKAFDKSIANDLWILDKNKIEIETSLGALKGKFGDDNKKINIQASHINNERDKITKEKREFNAQRAKANSGKYSARKGGK